MNWLKTPAGQRPDLPVRDAGGDAAEVQCPVCGNWRPGFLIMPVAEDRLAEVPGGWACDMERSRWHRAAEAAANPQPPDPISPATLLTRLSPAEALALLRAEDAPLAVLWAQAMAQPLLPVDGGVLVAMLDRAQTLGVVDAARRAAILGGA